MVFIVIIGVVLLIGVGVAVGVMRKSNSSDVEVKAMETVKSASSGVINAKGGEIQERKKENEKEPAASSATETVVEIKPAKKPVELKNINVDISKRRRPDTKGLPYVLVAEDNLSNYKLLEVMLRNIAVTENAVNGRKAVERAMEMDYDMILMDIKMPVMNGLEATNAIRQFDAKIPIIAVTANVLDFDKNLALANGCNEFVTKPVIRKRLCEVIDAYRRKN